MTRQTCICVCTHAHTEALFKMGVKHEYLQTFSFSLYLKWDRGNELDLALLQIQQLKYDLEVSADGVLSTPLGTAIKKHKNNNKKKSLKSS